MNIIRKKFTFYGSVQGVGFRYRAYYCARANNITGWVRNNFDGSVELEAEGDTDDIDNMLVAILRGRFIRVEDYTCETIPLQNSITFDIIR